MDSDTKTSRITRRKVLQQAGIGAAAAFAAPLLVSTSPAYASPGANVAGKTCATLALNGATSATGLGPCDWGDASSRPCPCHMGGFVGPVCDPQDSGRCFCFTDVKGCSQCRDVVQSPGAACTSNAQCPVGWKCVYTCLDACPNGVGCCDTCTGNSAPSSGPSGSGLVCLPPCSKTGAARLGTAARANMHRLAKAGG